MNLTRLAVSLNQPKSAKIQKWPEIPFIPYDTLTLDVYLIPRVHFFTYFLYLLNCKVRFWMLLELGPSGCQSESRLNIQREKIRWHDRIMREFFFAYSTWNFVIKISNNNRKLRKGGHFYTIFLYNCNCLLVIWSMSNNVCCKYDEFLHTHTFSQSSHISCRKTTCWFRLHNMQKHHFCNFFHDFFHEKGNWISRKCKWKRKSHAMVSKKCNLRSFNDPKWSKMVHIGPKST